MAKERSVFRLLEVQKITSQTRFKEVPGQSDNLPQPACPFLRERRSCMTRPSTSTTPSSTAAAASTRTPFRATAPRAVCRCTPTSTSGSTPSTRWELSSSLVLRAPYFCLLLSTWLLLSSSREDSLRFRGFGSPKVLLRQTEKGVLTVHYLVWRGARAGQSLPPNQASYQRALYFLWRTGLFLFVTISRTSCALELASLPNQKDRQHNVR
jgi:hypothetical protein